MTFFNRLAYKSGAPWKALLAFSPAFVLAWLMATHAVNTPVWDDWERVPLISKFHNGTLTFNDLYAPHIDHRIFFPRLIILALNVFTNGDMRWEIGVNFLLGLATAVGIWQLSRQTIFREKTNWWVVFIANLILFSPVKWDNWLWAIQIAFLLPMACLVWALFVCGTAWRWWVRLIVALLLAVVGTHSFGHGFVVWPAIFGLVLLTPHFSERKMHRWWFLTIWLVCGAVVMACYALLDFTNISHPAHAYGQNVGDAPPSVSYGNVVLEDPWTTFAFVITMVGNPLSRIGVTDPAVLAFNCGIVLLIAFSLLAAWCFIRRVGKEKSDLLTAAMPWLALGAASFVGLLAVTVGRVVFGLSKALSIRYISISEYLLIAVVFLLSLYWLTLGQKFWQQGIKKWMPGFSAMAAGLIMAGWFHGAVMMDLWSGARWHAKAALQFINHWDSDVFWRIDAEMNLIRHNANILNDLGQLDPPLATSLELEQYKPVQAARPPSQAAVTDFRKQEDGTFHVEGYARLRDRDADGVFLTCEIDGAPPRIFAMAEPVTTLTLPLNMQDFDHLGKMPPLDTQGYGWREDFKLESLGFKPGENEARVRFWSYDAKEERALRISGEWILTATGEWREVEPSVPRVKQFHTWEL